jgi:hypothetical protein
MNFDKLSVMSEKRGDSMQLDVQAAEQMDHVLNA